MVSEIIKLDTQAGYEEHKLAIFQEMEPVGSIESMLVEQLVLTIWQLKELTQYENALLAKEEKSIEQKLEEWWEWFRPQVARHYGVNEALQSVYDAVECAQEIQNGLEEFRRLKLQTDDTLELNGPDVVFAMWRLADHAGCETEIETKDGEFYIVPGESEKFYPIDDDSELDAGWTVGRAKRCLAHIARHARCSPSELVETVTAKEYSSNLKYYKALVAINDEKKKLEEEAQKPVIPYGTNESTSRLMRKMLMDDIFELRAKLEESRAKREGVNALPRVTITNPLLSG